MKKGRITIGSRFSTGVPGKRTPGQEVQDAGGGIALMLLAIGLGSLFLFAAVKGCNEEMKKSQSSAQVSTMR